MADEWDSEITNEPVLPKSNGFQPIKEESRVKEVDLFF
jgi:hypothetical protein